MFETFDTAISDLKLFRPQIFEDDRGYFYESFNKTKLQKELGIDFNIEQINQSKSTKNVLRGLHFQNPPFEQAKLVSVIEGEVLDIAVDIRKDSSTFGMHESVVLNDVNKHHFYVPKGFAHGFLVLSDHVKFMYGVDNVYSPQHESGIYYSDPTLNIDWGDIVPILSKKDSQLQSFDLYKQND